MATETLACSFSTHFYQTYVKKAHVATSWLLTTHSDGTLSLEKKQARPWRVLGQIRKNSYDIEVGAQKFLEQMQKSLLASKTRYSEESTAYKTELTCAITCSIFVKDLLKNSQKNGAKPKARQEARQTLQKQFKTCTYEYINTLARLEKCTPASSATKHEMVALAVSLLSKGGTLDDDKGRYNALLSEAFKRKKLDVCLVLIQKGADPTYAIHEKQNEAVTLLLKRALETKNTACALILIEKNPDLSFKDLVDKSSFLHMACRQEMHDVVVRLVQKKTLVNCVDTDGTTPLHIACSRLDATTARFLLQHGSDVCKKNDQGLCPLQVPLNSPPSDAVNQFYSGLFCNIPNIKKIVETRGIGHFIEQCTTMTEKILKESPTNVPLEIAFILQHEQMAKAIAKCYTKPDYEKALDHIKQNFPSSALDFLYFCPFELNREHIEIPFYEKEIEPPQEEISLDELLTLFDSIQDIKIHFPHEPPQALRKKLVEFVRRIKQQVVFEGVPKKLPDRKVFYKTIENGVKNILVTFKNSQASLELEAKKRAFLQEVLNIVFLCGGRYFLSMSAAFRNYCKGRSEKLEDEILRCLAEYRELIAHTIVDKNDDHNANAYNYILRIHGKALNLPGKNDMAKYVDPAHKLIDEKELTERFFTLYTPENIQNGWLAPMLHTNEALRSRFIDWHKAHIPKEFKQGPHAYLATVVFDTSGKIRKEAITYFLLNMTPNIFSCTHRKTDPHLLGSIVHMFRA